MSAKNLTVTKGDTLNFSVPVTDSDGTVFDLTGYDMQFTAKSDLTVEDVDADISASATIATPTNGIGVFSIPSSDTDIEISSDTLQYTFDVQISDGVNNVYTVIKLGKIYITDEVTKEA